MRRGKVLGFGMVHGKRVYRIIERIRIGEGAVPTRGDCVGVVFSHDLDVLIHLLFRAAI